MIWIKKRTIPLSAVAITAAIVLFASAPLVAPHQAQAYWGGGWGWHHGWGHGGWHHGWGHGGWHHGWGHGGWHWGHGWHHGWGHGS